MTAVAAFLVLVLALAASSLASSPLPPGEPGGAFVHLFEWSWDDVARECEEWLGPKGFVAVQVSPPAEHIAGPQWWTRYQPVSYNLTSRSGDEAAFASMVARCRAAGVGIYADVILNHCAGGEGIGVAGSPYGGRRFPLFDAVDFHHSANDLHSNCGVSDYNDKHNVQFCDLSGMPDLCTECEHVQETLAAYLNHLAQLGVAGVRIDAAKHQDVNDLSKVLGRVNSSLKVFLEISDTQADAVDPMPYTSLGLVTEFKYNVKLDENILPGGRLQSLESFGNPSWGFIPSSTAIVFVDNHDTQREKSERFSKISYKSGPLYTLAVMFMLAHPYGYPQLMSSYAFDSFDEGPPPLPVHGLSGELQCGGKAVGGESGKPWICEHRWPPIANMVAWRKVAGEEPLTRFEAFEEGQGDVVLLCRGSVACVAFNRLDDVPWEGDVVLPMPPGEYCDVARSAAAESCPTLLVAAGGLLSLRVPPLSAVALHVGAPASLELSAVSAEGIRNSRILRHEAGGGGAAPECAMGPVDVPHWPD